VQLFIGIISANDLEKLVKFRLEIIIGAEEKIDDLF